MRITNSKNQVLMCFASIFIMLLGYGCGDQENGYPIDVVDENGQVVDNAGYALESVEPSEADRAIGSGDAAAQKNCSTLCECGRIWHPCNFEPNCEYYCNKVDGESLQSQEEVNRNQSGSCGTDSTLRDDNEDSAQPDRETNRTETRNRKRGSVKRWLAKRVKKLGPVRIQQIDVDSPFRLIRTRSAGTRASNQRDEQGERRDSDADRGVRGADSTYTICPDLTTICGPHAPGEPDTSCCPEEDNHEIARADETRDRDSNAGNNR
jgi:hypothetical protein